jgi:hypothetical protein
LLQIGIERLLGLFDKRHGFFVMAAFSTVAGRSLKRVMHIELRHLMPRESEVARIV